MLSSTAGDPTLANLAPTRTFPPRPSWTTSQPPAQAPMRGDDTPVMEFVVEAIRGDVDRVLDVQKNSPRGRSSPATSMRQNASD